MYLVPQLHKECEPIIILLRLLCEGRVKLTESLGSRLHGLGFFGNSAEIALLTRRLFRYDFVKLLR